MFKFFLLHFQVQLTLSAGAFAQVEKIKAGHILTGQGILTA